LITPDELMQAAIDIARRGIEAGQSPFGCAIARDGEIITTAHNVVLATTDITAHAEITAIRRACAAVDNIFLEGTIVASTCEPCPMCAAALHWSRAETVYYGASIADAAQVGFSEMLLPAAEVAKSGGNRTRLVGGVLREECQTLFDEWGERDDRQHY
jgi:guanine deaminase